MSEETLPKIQDFKLVEEESHCSFCREYLCDEPVLLLEDGRSKCSRCEYSMPRDDPQAYINKPLENILRKFSFPCPFVKGGCTESSIPFGSVYEHVDSECDFNNIVACPALPVGSCSWKKSLSKMPDHFQENHISSIDDDFNGTMKFKLQIDKNSEGFALPIRGNVYYAVKYVYDVKDGVLKYDIRHCSERMYDEIITSVRLTNDADTAYTVTIKARQPLPYDSTFNDMQNAVLVNLSKYLPGLEDPVSILVEICIKFVEYPEI